MMSMYKVRVLTTLQGHTTYIDIGGKIAEFRIPPLNPGEVVYLPAPSAKTLAKSGKVRIIA